MAEIIADLRATEDPEKLIKMIKNVFPHSVLKTGKDEILGDIKDSDFWDTVDREKVRDTVEGIIEKNNGYIDISKTALAAGKIAPDEEHPLGKVRIKLR